MLRRQIALINSMTKKERANPDLLQASRKRRIAAGAGLEVSELNKLLKMHRQMADTMKKIGKGGMLKQAMKEMFGKGGRGMPDLANMNPDEMQEAAAALPRARCPPWRHGRPARPWRRHEAAPRPFRLRQEEVDRAPHGPLIPLKHSSRRHPARCAGLCGPTN